MVFFEGFAEFIKPFKNTFWQLCIEITFFFQERTPDSRVNKGRFHMCARDYNELVEILNIEKNENRIAIY